MTGLTEGFAPTTRRTKSFVVEEHSLTPTSQTETPASPG